MQVADDLLSHSVQVKLSNCNKITNNTKTSKTLKHHPCNIYRVGQKK